MTDAVTTEVFANLFKAVVDEMAWIALRSSHTTFVKETQDFAVSLVTNEGEIFAYPYGRFRTPPSLDNARRLGSAAVAPPGRQGRIQAARYSTWIVCEA